jgi:enoyl-CoA hydratase/carnithine racemase
VVAGEQACFGMSLAQIGLRAELVPHQARAARRRISLSRRPRVIDWLAANAPLSLKAMKTMTVRQLEVRDAVPHDDVDALVRAALSSEDAREGMLARLEKRSARFQGK